MLLSAAGSSGYKFLAAEAAWLDNAAGIRAIIAPVVLISPQNGLVTTRRGGRQQPVWPPLTRTQHRKNPQTSTNKWPTGINLYYFNICLAVWTVDSQ